jgi:hypothetical protein
MNIWSVGHFSELVHRGLLVVRVAHLSGAKRVEHYAVRFLATRLREGKAIERGPNHGIVGQRGSMV